MIIVVQRCLKAKVTVNSEIISQIKSGLMLLVGINKGDEVIIPVQTFVSTGSCVINNGGTPVFCEINENYLIDFDDLKEKEE